MGKSTISMAIFNSYFDITRGYISHHLPTFHSLGFLVAPKVHARLGQRLLGRHQWPAAFGERLPVNSRVNCQLTVPRVDSRNLWHVFSCHWICEICSLRVLVQFGLKNGKLQDLEKKPQVFKRKCSAPRASQKGWPRQAKKVKSVRQRVACPASTWLFHKIYCIISYHIHI